MLNKYRLNFPFRIELITIKDIPISSYKDLSERLIALLLVDPKSNTLSIDLLNKITNLLQLDQLATKTGIRLLAEAAITLDVESTYKIFNELGIQGIIKIED